ncbi:MULTISPECIES: GlxA family transcriptional regulator [unclassified Microbispora]|uniref:GlxA family transcriptional regulator n=1 Tax=unclassified Microbispora TaxID=2614687 RepID=UPI0014735950|nr:MULTISPECIES: helix-turn-helix domain-containing protein [unclassified Microbispora]
MTFHRVAVVLFDRTPMFESAVPISVFGEDRPGLPPFDVRVVGGDGGSEVRTNAGVRLATPHGLDAVAGSDLVIVPTYRRPPDEPPPVPALDALRAAHERGAIVAGLCLGTFVLAAAGLLGNRAASTHWAYAGLLARLHPDVSVRADDLYVDEGRILTSAGSAGGIDLCLHLVRREFGADAATAIARRMVVAPHRSGGQAQFVEHPVPGPAAGDPLGAALGATLDWAVRHLDRPLGADALAARALMSRRTFDRRFREATGTSPARWLLHQRVLHAQRLLETSDLPVEQVARRCGFASAVALRPHFRRLVGVSPAAYRQSFGWNPSVDG